MTTTSDPLRWQGFFDYPNSADEVAVAAMQRDCYREMTAQANAQRKRLGPAEIDVEAPLVMDYPEVDEDSEDLPEPVGRKPEEGETATHTRRVLVAPILNPEVTPDEAMHAVAAAQLDTIEESQRVDRSGWTQHMWAAEAKTIMASEGGTVRALLDNHVLALLGRLADAEESLPTIVDAGESPLSIDSAFIERLTDAMIETAHVHIDHEPRFDGCACGWPGKDHPNPTAAAMARHRQTQRAAAMTRWLVEHDILPAPPTIASLPIPDGLRIGHCDLCGQTMIAADGEPPYHPYNALRPCPEPPRGPDGEYVAGNSPEYLAWLNGGENREHGRPGAEHFVHDSDTLYPDTQ